MSPHPPLFCKPESTEKILFSKHDANVKGRINFRSIVLQSDIPIIYEWVNRDYAIEYWQMNGSFSQLSGIYQCMEHNPYAHSFIGLLPRTANAAHSLKEGDCPSSTMICQFDVYSVFADELRDHVALEIHDCGFHLLMAPNDKPIKGLTVAVVETFLHYYFSFVHAKRMYAEPDVANVKSIALLEACGFEKIRKVQMSYKEAVVYCMDRKRFDQFHGGSVTREAKPG